MAPPLLHDVALQPDPGVHGRAGEQHRHDGEQRLGEAERYAEPLGGDPRAALDKRR